MFQLTGESTTKPLHVLVLLSLLKVADLKAAGQPVSWERPQRKHENISNSGEGFPKQKFTLKRTLLHVALSGGVLPDVQQLVLQKSKCKHSRRTYVHCKFY